MFRILLCSFFFVLLYPTAIDIYLVGLPQIAADLNASDTQLHIAFSIYLAGMATTMLFAGKIADSLGRKPVAIVGSIIFIAASLLAAVTSHIDTFLLARFAQGVGAGSCYVVAFAILRDSLEQQRRAKVLSMINGITCIIPVIAPVVGHLIMLKFPWRTLFFVMMGMGLVVCLLASLVFKETKANALPKSQLNEAKSQESFYDLLFISRLIIAAVGVTTILTYVNVSPMIMMDELALSRGDYSALMAGMALVSMLTSFAAPLALNYLSQRTLMLTGQVFIVIAAIVLGIAHAHYASAYSYVLGCVFICFGFSIGFGVTMSQALTPYALRAGVASSLLAIAQVCSSSTYIWLMGVLGVNPLNMLIFITIMGGAISLALILFTSKIAQESHYEEIASSS